MPSELLLKVEIVILLASFLYTLSYIFSILNKMFFHVKKAIVKEDITNIKVALNKVDLSAKEDNYRKANNNKKLTNEEQRQVSELIKRVRIKTSKKFYEEAKALIIEGLAIDKFNRDLNTELAFIYEKEGNHSNAEYIYKDILEQSKNDMEIIKKLAKAYFMQGKLEESYQTYLKVNRKAPGDEEVLNMLSEISYDIKDYKEAIKYINDFLKFKPRDVDKLIMKAISFENLRDFKEALDVYKKILEIQPYNTFARDRIRELTNMG